MPSTNLEHPLIIPFTTCHHPFIRNQILLHLIRNSPGAEPLQVLKLLVASNHTPRNRHKQDVQSNDHGIENTIDNDLHSLAAVSEHPVGAETVSKDGKVQGWVIVMDIGDSGHDDERKVVQEPSDDWVDTGVMNLVNLRLLELVVATLPAKQVPEDN